MATEPCKPRRSVAARWARATKISLIALAAGFAIAVFLPPGSEFFAPGPLSSGHRQILGSKVALERCGACHPGATGSVADWFLKSDEQAHAGVTQTDLCLNCHHNLIPRVEAKRPHSLPADKLASITEVAIQGRATGTHQWLPAAKNSGNDLACAACHREHHGNDPSFTKLTDAQCQTCHSQQFTSFSLNHPDWTAWPYGRGGQIKFDHRTHEQRHFPGKQTQWDCTACHKKLVSGEIQRVVSYETACAVCHDQPLQTQAQEGFALFQVPMIDVAALKAADMTPPAWPTKADGFTEWKLPPIMRLLMRSKDDVAADIAALPPNQPPTPAQLTQLMVAVRDLADELATEGQPAIDNAFKKLLDVPAARTTFTGQLSLQLGTDASWWPGARPVITNNNTGVIKQMQYSGQEDPLLSESSGPDGTALTPAAPPIVDPLASDAASGDALSQPTDDRLTPPRIQRSMREQMAKGGWYRDDVTLAIRYRPSGHADPQLRTLIELTLEAQEVTTASTRQTWQETQALPALQACLGCHHPEKHGEQWSWKAIGLTERPRGFTKFSHRSHLHQPLLSDCRHCHQTAELPTTDGGPSAATQQVTFPVHDFVPLNKNGCVTCHRPSAAGESCTQCHNYHVDALSLTKP